jgi:hypothetical protein
LSSDDCGESGCSRVEVRITETNRRGAAAAEKLDTKLAALATEVTGVA